MANDSLQGPRFEIELGSEQFPQILADIPNPPKRIYGIGNPEALVPGVAVIGARKATPYGLSCAECFSEHIARAGYTIISGGARGCDQAAHKAAVASGAPTVVVFGSAADVVYPRSGRALFQQVVDAGGAVISEQPWGMQPHRALFPQRNRIIAGLAMLVLIVEAGLPSGTFSTADAALHADRDVAVVPGSITSANSKGSNMLLSQGAMAVLDYETLDTALEIAATHSPYSLLAQSVQAEEELAVDCDDLVIRALCAESLSADELASYFGFTVSELSQQLSYYEIQGVIQRGRDGRYQVCPKVLRR